LSNFDRNIDLNDLQFKENLKLLNDFRKKNELFKLNEIKFYYTDEKGVLKDGVVIISDFDNIRKTVVILKKRMDSNSNLFINLLYENEIEYIINCFYIQNYEKMRNLVLNFREIYNLKKEDFKIAIDIIKKKSDDKDIALIFNEVLFYKLLKDLELKESIDCNFKVFDLDNKIEYYRSLNLLNNLYDYLKIMDSCFYFVNRLCVNSGLDQNVITRFFKFNDDIKNILSYFDKIFNIGV
jgi:hypothetical protein